MIHFFLAAALTVAPAPAPTPSQDHADHHGSKQAECKMECCKGDKPMPCCEKMKAAGKTADAPAAEGHGAHEHDH
nr:hypothetical protein [uncultured Sphingomonas sp.]